MLGCDRVGRGKVRNRARNFEHAMKAARGQVKFFRGAFE
jgi:hypothetical protein